MRCHRGVARVASEGHRRDGVASRVRIVVRFQRYVLVRSRRDVHNSVGRGTSPFCDPEQRGRTAGNPHGVNQAHRRTDQRPDGARSKRRATTRPSRIRPSRPQAARMPKGSSPFRVPKERSERQAPGLATAVRRPTEADDTSRARTFDARLLRHLRCLSTRNANQGLTRR